MDRVQIVHENFLRRVAAGELPSGSSPSLSLDGEAAIALYRNQCLSRALDRVSRVMQREGQGFYTIGSSGHEGMASVAQSLRPTDPAFLHYRDAAFQLTRADQIAGQTAVWDMLLSFACSSEDPISGGRHKVLGSYALNIPPQTSTIASHLPKAVGAAYAIGLGQRHQPEHRQIAEDSIIMCSFGDASVNHSTAQGAFNSAAWTAYQSLPLPLLFVCEDNGIGISTPTPQGWIRANFENRPGLNYFCASGLDFYATCEATRAAAEFVRSRRKPAFLHLNMVRLYGHAGADVAETYMSQEKIDSAEANDPLLHSVRLLDQAGVMTPPQSLEIYIEAQESVTELAGDVASRPHLRSAAEVKASLIPPARKCKPVPIPSAGERRHFFGQEVQAIEAPQPMSRHINWALTELMLTYPEVICMGEDIGRKGGVYGITRGLQRRFGADRVMDTLLDEQSILGLAIGTAHNGFIPIPEIQFLAYLHNAEDQIRGEAATLPFFSNGQYANPMVVRIAGLGYQKGFGGHFHNDNSIAVLRDIPGVVIACPSNGQDASAMLRECVRLAREEQRVVVFLEPIALYPIKDLHRKNDGLWMSVYRHDVNDISLGQIGIHGTGRDLAIVTYGNGHYLSRMAEREIRTLGIDLRIIDLRWLAPLPERALLDAVRACESILIVDECRRTGGQAEALMAVLAEAGHKRVRRLTAEDSFIATGPAHGATLPGRDQIVTAAGNVVRESRDSEFVRGQDQVQKQAIG